MKAPRLTTYKLWTGTACLALAAILAACSTGPPPASTADLSPVHESLQTGRPSAQEVFDSAKALRRSERHDEALQAFTEFIEQFPDDPLAHDARLAMGQLAAELGRLDAATAAYTEVIKGSPDSLLVDAYLGLAHLRYEQKDYAASREALQEAFAASPSPSQRSQAHYLLGTSSLALGAYRDAAQELSLAAAATDPELADKAYELLAEVVRNHLDIPQLELLASRFSRALPGALLVTELAHKHRAEGNTQGEFDALRRLAEAFPEHPDADATLERLQVLEALLATDPTKLGVLLPLSGPTGQIGRSALRSVQLALDMFQQRHAGLELSLVIRDTGASTETARGALRALVEEARVIGVIGPLLSQTAEELAPLADELAVPLFSPFARDSRFPQLSPYAFRNSLTDAMQGRLLASYATRQLGLRRFAVLFPDDAYGTALADHFRDSLVEHDGRVVVRAAYSPDAPDPADALQRIRAETYDALLVPDYADNIALLAPELAFDAAGGVQLLGTDGWNDPQITTIASRAVDGAVFVDGFFAESPVPHVESFVNGFRERYGAIPDLLAAQAYDTLTMCARVLRSGVRTRPQLRDGLARIRDFPGVSGVTSMDADGDAEKVLYVLSVREGRIIQINAPAFRYPDAGDPVD